MTHSPPQSGHIWNVWHPIALLLIIAAIVGVEETWLRMQPNSSETTQQTTTSPAPGTAAGSQAQQPNEDEDCKIKDTAAPSETRRVKLAWALIMILLILFVLVAGHGITGCWLGALIDNRNKFSLSRFQMASWTVLILSAYLTAVLINIHRGQPNATDICLDETLWGLMGISTVSLVGSPLILSRKKALTIRPFESPPASGIPEKTREALTQQGVNANRVEAEGSVIRNLSKTDASWTDLFKGDTVDDAGHLDLGKIQMFLFTIITLLTYAVALGDMFGSHKTGIVEFPILSEGMLALLSISHAGYLVNKAASGPPSSQNI